ncbi:hypothetical protein LCGC14_3126880, partial [marine sediment metagenome]
FAPYLGGGILAMLAMMLLGIPVYVCATASVPVAVAMIGAGVSPGAALVFLMTGPATNAAALATVWKVMGRRTALIYLGTVAISALASGMLLDYVFQVGGVTLKDERVTMLPNWLKLVSAVVLLAVLGWALVRPWLHKHKEMPVEDQMPTHALEVRGMTCSNCAGIVQRTLLECPGVASADVDLDAATATVAGRDLDLAALCAAVAALGFEAKPVGGNDQA